MKLHLGCGKRDFGEEWTHVDKDAFDHVQYEDVTMLPFEDNSCDIIYSSHLLEYFDRQEVVSVLDEWRRVLKPKGILRAAVPDFEAMCKLYNEGWAIEKFLGPLYGKWGETPMRHKTVYDFDSLSTVLEEAGFKDVHLYDWRLTEHAHIDDHSQAYLPHMDKDNGTLISLNVEAYK